MVTYIEEMSVKEYAWLDNKTFKDGAALCQAIPGATAMQVAAYVGLRAKGAWGSFCTFVGFGPPVFATYAFAFRSLCKILKPAAGAFHIR